MFEVPDFTDPYWFALLFLGFFIVIIGRYLLIAGLFYAAFYVRHRQKYDQQKLGKQPYKKGQLRKEIGWSTISAIIFSLAGCVTILLFQQGFTKIYTDASLYAWWWLPLSLVISMLIHETYYYWTHRLMHHRSLFRIIHKVHHDSHTTSPFTAFSFHPLEGFIQAIILPVTLMIIPMHPSIILVQLVIMSFSSVINHLNIEIYPASLQKHSIGRLIIGATHHSLHHKQYRYNFGLYFTFWDKLAKTEGESAKNASRTQKSTSVSHQPHHNKQEQRELAEPHR